MYNQFMTQKDAVNYWLTSSQQNFSTARDMAKTGHYDWSLFMWHLVIEKMLKAAISQKGKTPIVTHNLTKLVKQADLEFPEKYEEYLKEITGFNLETRYDDYKFTFYKKATKKFATKWTIICEEIYQWLIKKCK